MDTPLIDYRPAWDDISPDTILNAFITAMLDREIELYPAQEEAILEVLEGRHVILNTPTGSGKTLVALAMQFKALCEGRRCVYTSPIKALVSEKFFALCRDFGPENVGMMTGDASVNRDAPILCCTAEILSNLALREGEETSIHDVIMDEFHYFADRDRGVAWQVPLVTMRQTTFLLMSATLGDTADLEKKLKAYTGTDVSRVASATRPVPLDYLYCETPVHETIQELLSTNRAPIYIVNFTQREAAQMAQSLTSIDVLQKDEKSKLKEALVGAQFDSPYGKDMRRYIHHGIGLHHAGLLPKYRLCVEQMAQQGHLKIICGTDTLGVGVNIPIRTVLFTKLCKFDGQKTAILTVRDFKQISGRAGRKGFDDSGSVVCQAPEHVVENKRAEARHAVAQGKKKRKIVKKQPPDKGYVHWDSTTFERLQERDPEELQSRFEVSHAMVLNLLQGRSNGYRELMNIIKRSFASDKEKRALRKRAAVLLRSLVGADLVQIRPCENGSGAKAEVNPDLQIEFSLNQTLSLYLVETIKYLKTDDDQYALSLLTLVESILENPRAILLKQLDRAKSEKIAELKAAGVEYERRMEELEKVEYPKPNREFVYQTFNQFSADHPWVGAENIRPKSIVREMVDRYMSFSDYVKEYQLQRSEGLLLRYLSQAYRVLVQTVPQQAYDEKIIEVIAFLRNQIARVDSSLIEEWEELVVDQDGAATEESTESAHWMHDSKGLFAEIRANLHALVHALGKKDYEEAAQWLNHQENGWTVKELEGAMNPFYADYETLQTGHQARFPRLTQIKECAPLEYEVCHTLVDSDEACDWMVKGAVKLKDWDPRLPIFHLLEIRR